MPFKETREKTCDVEFNVDSELFPKSVNLSKRHVLGGTEMLFFAIRKVPLLIGSKS